MRNTIVVKSLPIRMLLAERAVSEILQTQTEVTSEVANTIAKLVVLKMDEILRMEGFGRNDNIVQQVTEILAQK